MSPGSKHLHGLNTLQWKRHRNFLLQFSSFWALSSGVCGHASPCLAVCFSINFIKFIVIQVPLSCVNYSQELHVILQVLSGFSLEICFIGSQTGRPTQVFQGISLKFLISCFNIFLFQVGTQDFSRRFHATYVSWAIAYLLGLICLIRACYWGAIRVSYPEHGFA